MALDVQDDLELQAELRELKERVRKLEANTQAMSQAIPLLQVDGIEIGRDFFRGEQGALQLQSTASLFPAIAFVNEFHDPLASPSELGISGTAANGGVFGFVTSGGQVQIAFGASTDANNKAYIVTESQDGSGVITLNAIGAGNSVGPQLSASDLGNNWNGKLGLGSAVILQIGRLTADPTTLADFDIWGRSDTDVVHVRLNGVTRTFLVDGASLTQLDGTAHRLFYTDGNGDIQELAFGTSGQVLTANGTTSAPSFQDAAGGGGMSLIVQENDQAFTGTLANTELLFAVAANEVFAFEGVLMCEVTAGGAVVIEVNATGPSGAVGSLGAIGTDSAGGTDTDVDNLGTAVVLTMGDTAHTLVRFWGGIHNGANAGNLTIQVRETGAGSLNLLAGSQLKWQEES